MPPLSTRRVPRNGFALFCAVLALYALTASGTIASSDGTTMYQLARSLAHDHSIAVPSGNALPGRDGRLYAKAGIGQALCAVPFVWAGDALGRVAPAKSEFVTRAVVSTMMPLIGALGVWVLYALLSALGCTRRGALYAAAAFAIATPQWVYAKMFLTEALTTLCLLLGVLGVARARGGGAGWLVLAGAAFGWALVTKSAMLAAVAPLLAWGVWDARRRRADRAQRFVALLAPVIVCAGVVMWYNAARFGSVFASGYGAETSALGFSTPILVGLYGLLLSSGKSVFLYAPLLLLAIPGAALLLRRHTHERALMLAIAAMWCINLPVYASFMSWAGDGSWGPRYLVPFIGVTFIPIALYLNAAHGARHTLARWLTALGVFVTIGGVAVYFGAVMREAGEYPYTRDFRDPRFLQESHFNPAFSPVAGHWRMLLRNAGEHLRGDIPRIATGAYATDARTPLTQEQATQLLHGLDFWWCYAMYAGLPRAPLALACVALLACAAFAWKAALP